MKNIVTKFVGIPSFGKEFDAHTLEAALEQVKRLVGKSAKTATRDRGNKQIGETRIQIPKSFNKKTQTKYQKLCKEQPK